MNIGRDGGGDGLLHQHIEGVGGYFQFLDLPLQHALHRHGGLQQITAVFRMQHTC